MTLSHESVISWVLGELRRSEEEGITISKLFEGIENYAHVNEDTKVSLWSDLVCDKNILLLDGKETELSKSPLRKLGLEDVLALGLGEKRIYIRQKVKLTNDDNLKPLDAGEDQSFAPQILSQSEDIITTPSALHVNVSQAASTIHAQPTELGSSLAMDKEGSTELNSLSYSEASLEPGIFPSTPVGREREITKANSIKKIDSNLKKATYTPYEQIRYEAGISGAYINPKVTGSAEPTRGRPIKRPRLIVFKSEMLKDPTWLERRKGTWHEYFAEAIASQIIDAEDSNHGLRKRKTESKFRITISDSEATPKRRRVSKKTKNSTPFSPYQKPAENWTQSEEEINCQDSDDNENINQSTPKFAGPSGKQEPQKKIVTRRTLIIKSNQSLVNSRPSREMTVKSSIQSEDQDSSSTPSGLNRLGSHLNLPATGHNTSPASKSSIISSMPRRRSSRVDSNQTQAIQDNNMGNYNQSTIEGDDLILRASLASNEVVRRDLSSNSLVPASSPKTTRRSAKSNQNHITPRSAILTRVTPRKAQLESTDDTILSTPCLSSNHLQSPGKASEQPITNVINTQNLTGKLSDRISDKMNDVLSDKNLLPSSPEKLTLSTNEDDSRPHTQVLVRPSLSLLNKDIGKKYGPAPYGSPDVSAPNKLATLRSALSAAETNTAADVIAGLKGIECSETRKTVSPTSDSHSQNPISKEREIIEPEASQKSLAPEADISNMQSESEESLLQVPQTENSLEKIKGKRSYSQATQQEQSPLVGNQPKKLKLNLKKRIRGSEPPNNVESDLKEAAAIQFPAESARLTCIYQGKAGNLILSENKQILKFLSLNQSSDSELFKLDISDIAQNPITSITGSVPMELRIKEGSQGSEIIIHTFEFPPTTTAIESANNMRAKIVTGIVACKLRSGQDYNHPVQIKEEMQKPYKCETCEKRFKNQNGLEYHVSKAATTCNPNFDPQVGPGKRGRKKRKQSLDTSNNKAQEGEDAPPPIDPQQTNPEQDHEKHDSSDDAGSSSESDASVMSWAMKNSTSGIGRIRKARELESSETLASRRIDFNNKNPKESEVYNENERNLATAVDKMELLLAVPQSAKTPLDSIAEKVFLSSTMESNKYEALMLSLVQANNNIFPGDQSLWFCLIALWLKQSTSSQPSDGLVSAPEYKECNKFLDNLIETKKLERNYFTIQGQDGKHYTRCIISTPGTDLKSHCAMELSRLIKECVPSHYVPPQFSPGESILSKLGDLDDKNSIASLNLKDNTVTSHLGFQSSALPPNLVDLGTCTNPDNQLVDSEMIETEKEPADSANDEIATTPKELNQTRTKTWNSKISEGLRRYHQSLGRTSKPRPTRKKPNSQGAKGTKKYSSPDVSEQTWNCAQFYLQDPDTGTWDQLNSSFLDISLVSSESPRVFVESITYMQGENGSWSIRPIGHGMSTNCSASALFPTTPKALDKIRCIERKPRTRRSTTKIPSKNEVHRPLRHSKRLTEETPISKTRSTRKSKAKVTESVSAIDAPAMKLDTSTAPMRKVHVEDKAIEETPYDQHEPSSISERSKRYLTRSQGEKNSEISSETTTRESLHPSTKPSAHTNMALCNSDMIRFYEPKKHGIEAVRNPGLDTLPSSFGLFNSACEETTQKDFNYIDHYSEINFIAPLPVDPTCSFEEGSWTTTGVLSEIDDNYEVRWDEQTAFDMNSIPYQEMSFSLTFDEIVPKPLDIKIQKQSSISRCKQSNGSNRQRCTRLLTHLNVDFWGIGDHPESSSQFLGIPMAAGDEVAKLRKRNAHDSMSLAVEKRFIIAVIVIRALTGGIECLTDWVLVSLLFPKFSLNFMRGHWKQLLIRHKKIIDRLESDFQEAFVAAYESGEIAAIDYDDLQNYDWNKLIDWTMNTVDTSFSHKPVTIPDSRAELQMRYAMEVIDHKETWRDKWFETNAATYRRLDYASFHALSIPVLKRSESESKIEPADLTVAKSWFRAMALSPEDENSSVIMEKKMLSFGNSLCEKALAALIESKVIIQRSKKRPNSGSRNYETTEIFSRSLRREVKPKCLRDASVFKRYLDSEFRSGKKCVRVDYMAWDGDIMVISNLQARERIELIAMGVPREKFGLTEGGYETKKIPRERLRFELDIYPTSSYIYDDENEILKKAIDLGPPRGKQMALPVWYSINETVIIAVWKDIYSAIAQVLALRAGVDIPELVRIFTPTMEEWEIKLLIDWGEKIGLFCRLHESIDGWIAGEWWWAYAMKLFANDRFIVGQDVRHEPKDPFSMKGRLSS
ncbi:BgTH12-06990 [Blumeria graminis f. sp. triticale]|uniref:BgTH12-06990 n=1 Tax=Blumeria graminis f. sp. triticale TaxID=1689686 RepID=A0A9W4D889_BLUGR|nr:BgTH12-06990 [Blumeria graminis f. sp. triticale]